MAEKRKGFDLATALSGVSKLDTGAEGREQIEYIDIEHILPDERNFYELSGIEELATNIELVGLQQPLRVRPGAEEGLYIAVSGHRRHAALRLLVGEGNERFRQVPCIVERTSEQLSEVETLLQELRLIYGNNDTRKLSPADISKQAERVEMLLYRLKEAGVEFPGKMRDHVAQACKVSASKLARLKVIRDKLIAPLQTEWRNGMLSESVAYAFAREDPNIQALMVHHQTGYGKYRENRKYWTESEIKRAAEAVTTELQPRKGPKGTCEACVHHDARLRRIAGAGEWGDHCGSGKCCHDCPNIGTCKFACPRLAGEVAKAKASAKAKRASELEDKKKRDEVLLAPRIQLWKRFGEARAAAGLSFEEYARKADVRAFRREKKVEDFERGQKITESSGGLPYAGGDGLDEWRIRPLIKAADALGVSIDYLLCRTDNPKGATETMAAASGGWVSAATPPPKDSRVLAYFDLGDGKAHRIECTFDGADYLLRGSKVDMPPIRWLLIPPVEDEVDE